MTTDELAEAERRARRAVRCSYKLDSEYTTQIMIEYGRRGEDYEALRREYDRQGREAERMRTVVEAATALAERWSSYGWLREDVGNCDIELGHALDALAAAVERNPE